MTKKNTKVVVILVFLGIISLVVAGSFFSTEFSIFGQGFTVSSISLSNPPVQGQQNEWIVNVLVNGFGQSIVGNLDKSEINYQGASAQYPLSINAQIDDNKGFYIINNQNPSTIQKYRVVVLPATTSKSFLGLVTNINPPSSCANIPVYTWGANGPSMTILGISLGSTVAARACIYTDNVATEAPVSASPNVNPSITLMININGQSQQVTMNDVSVKAFNNGLGSVAWVNNPLNAGSLGALSVGNQYVAIAQYGTKNWVPAYSNDYSSFSTEFSSTGVKFDSFVKYQTNVEGMSCTTASTTLDDNLFKDTANCVKQYLDSIATVSNSKADALLNGVKFRINNLDSATAYSNKDGKDGFLVDLGNIYASAPELVLRIKSNWLGIIYSSGTPQVIYPKGDSLPSFKSGETLNFDLKVKNIGTGQGIFLVQDVKCKDIRTLSSYLPASVDAGQTISIPLSFVSTGAQSAKESCSGSVVDAGSLKLDVFSFNYNMEAPAQCVENKTYAVGDKIQRCVNGILTDVETCNYGITTDEKGDFVCNSAPGDTILCEKTGKLILKSEWTKEKCEKNKFNLPLPIVFGSLAGLLVLALSSIKFFSNKNPGYLIAGLAIGSIVGLLVYFILNWISNNLLTIAIFGLAGGTAIYLFGGIFVVVATFIGLIISSFRGK